MIQDDEAIVSLEAWRHLKRPMGTAVCRHGRTVIDEQAGTVTCRDCDATLSAFWVLGQIAREENKCVARIVSLRKEAEELKTWVPFLRAQRRLERDWRGRSMLPVCPFCNHGLWPEDLQRHKSTALEIARRRKDGHPLPPSVKSTAENSQ